METKANPNPNGCLAKAMPDEPMFTLLGRDLEAPKAIRQWATLRIEGGQPADDDQILQALADADAFERWRSDNLGAWRDYKPAAEPDLIPTPSDEISNIAGRILGSRALEDQANGARFNSLLADAKKLAGFAMRADREAGPNHG